MKITFLGHAGLYIETRHGSILCDPWFNPAFFGSWYPFPANDRIAPTLIGSPDFLYISHEHQDHFDRKFLTEHVSKNARVLLPDVPFKGAFRARLEQCGFGKFLETRNSEPLEVGGLRLMISAFSSPSDGPFGDSALVVDDGETAVLNQNDSHPCNLDVFKPFGSFDAHFLQFSGAIWYPFVYNFPALETAELGRRKRSNQQHRAVQFIRDFAAKHVFPCAGPPCFLDDALFELNDFDNSPTNIFCDQAAFLEFMRGQGLDCGKLVVPGSVIRLDGRSGACDVVHSIPRPEMDSIFQDKRHYLETYRSRMGPGTQAHDRPSPNGNIDVVAIVKDWFEPLLAAADNICGAVDARVLVDCSRKTAFVIDFMERRVYPWTGQYCPYRFDLEYPMVEKCVADRSEDWVNGLFLSCRFRAERDLPYNEHLYTFFKCLSAERIAYVEKSLARGHAPCETFSRHGYRIQRRCPHQGADLERFGEIDGTVLTCRMHGWQFDLESGDCTTTAGNRLFVEPAIKP